MKTAMQELIDEMDIIKGQLWQEGLKDKSTMISDMIKKAVDKLEKEKEQIIYAGNACSLKTIVYREKIDKMSKDELRSSLVEDTISYGEEYYNQTYNQNK